MAKEKEETPVLMKNGRFEGPGADELNAQSKMSPEVQSICDRYYKYSATARKRRIKAEKKAKEKADKMISDFLNRIETIGCSFPFNLKHESTEGDTVLWDGQENGVAMVITDYRGRKKRAYVFPQNRDGKYALVPLKVHDYIFHAETITIKGYDGESKMVRLCKVYQLVEENENLGLWMLINVCVDNTWASTEGKLSPGKSREWNGKIPPRFGEAFKAVKAHHDGSKEPYADPPEPKEN